MFHFLLVNVLLITVLHNHQNGVSARLLHGVEVESFRRFPHHVNIQIMNNYRGGRNCSGTIISNQWILTAMTCLKGGERYRVDFHRLHLQNDHDYFSVEIPQESVYLHPTGFDDIALIKVPVIIKYTLHVNKVSVADGTKDFHNELAVVAGYNSTESPLSYGMFRVLNEVECRNLYGDNYDEHLQICASVWDPELPQYICDGSQGAGLVVQWPHKSHLIGIYTAFDNSCETKSPPIFVKVSRYLAWINTITRLYDHIIYNNTTVAPNIIPNIKNKQSSK